MRELLRVIGLNIADDLEDNINDNILKGLFQMRLLLVQISVQDLQDQF